MEKVNSFSTKDIIKASKIIPFLRYNHNDITKARRL